MNFQGQYDIYRYVRAGGQAQCGLKKHNKYTENLVKKKEKKKVAFRQNNIKIKYVYLSMLLITTVNISPCSDVVVNNNNNKNHIYTATAGL